MSEISSILKLMLPVRGRLAIAFSLLFPLPLFASTVSCPEGSVHVEETSETGAVGEWCEKDGLRHGPYVLREEGVLTRSGEFNHGKMSGLWKRHSKSGTVLDEGNWTENQPDGIWTFYDPDGKVLNRITFVRGERVENSSPQRWIWKRGQVLGAGVFQKSGGQVRTAFLNYLPGYRRGELTEWVGALSWGGLKSRDSVKPVVWVLSASAGMRLRLENFDRFRVEPRIGVHTWLGSANAASFHFDTGYDFVPGKAAVVAGLEHVNFKVNPTTLIKVGLEYRFGE